MKIRVPYLVQDPALTVSKGMTKPIEFRTFDRETFCLPGPVSRRVAVLDFDPDSGALVPGVPFVAPTADKPGCFDLADDHDHTAPEFLPVNVFGTVLAALYMYEESDALGREIEWAFDSSQLLVVPRAGEWANAFYQRESRSLQFFYFPARADSRRDGTVYTGLSQDIIAHETAHAILDGIAPDLYNSLTPQSLAIHEAVADLTSLLSALRSRNLRSKLLDDTGGRIDGRTALSSIAEQFGFERDHSGRATSLRSLWNNRTLDPNDQTLDDMQRRNFASRAEPHMLSEVLSGALFRVLAHLHEEYKSFRAADQDISEFRASGWALFVATEHFKRLILRSLDYLPPGEVSYADYGRAILASDKASYQNESYGRNKLVELFAHRKIVDDPVELEVDTNIAVPEVAELDLDTFLTSDWVAYTFVNDNRHLFQVPPGVNFRVYPRLKATKEYRTGDGTENVTECIVKVSWDRLEDNPRGFPIATLRQITVGTTLVIDWSTQVVRAVLVSDAARLDNGDTSPSATQQQDDRDAMLTKLLTSGRLAFGAESPSDAQFGTAARVEISGDTMRLRATAQMLHLTDDEDDDDEIGSSSRTRTGG